MLLKNRKATREAEVLWDRRATALEAGTTLMSAKPDRENWTDEELRVWRYALAISRRLDKLH